MKKILLSISAFLCIFATFAKDVNETVALQAAKNFFALSSTEKITLAYSCKVEAPESTLFSAGKNIYYIFNVENKKGFVIISAEDAVMPVLGYSRERNCEMDNLPPAFVKWLENYKEQIIYAKENRAEADEETEKKWQELLNPTPAFYEKTTAAVNPLCNTTWDQSPYYNALCPGGSVTGCVATAMAQIMKFWNHPQTGSGIHSYNHPTYGTLSANFGATTYQWGSMPNSLNSNNNAVATLMLHCGISVDMNYSPNLSTAWVIASDNPVCAQNSYINYFGYDATTIQGVRRQNYNDNAWKNLLKNELDNGRPLQYAGFGSGGGHTWVCDGYDNSDFFHMNWGWGGSGPDGFFSVDALNPPSLGTGGGNGGFNSGQQACIGIKPANGGTVSNADIQLYANIVVNPDPINFGMGFTVTANVINNGTSDFSGEYSAALFTSSGDFVDFVEILSTGGNPLPSGYYYTNGITFTSQGLLAVPGNYQVGIFYKPNGGNWQLAGTTWYTNPVNVTINGPSAPIALYSNITPTPSTFVQGQAASVNVNLINNGFSNFYGQYAAALYDLSGNYVTTIGTLNEPNGLPSGYVYLAPYLTFSTSALDASPGTYLLAILYNESGTQDWYLCGGQQYTNPVNIIVTAPALQPDMYEVNNTQSTSYNLNLNWSGNSVNRKTPGANIHTGTDIDFYRVNLASGYNYTITCRAHDSYNSADGNTYTNDVLWSYRVGNGNWSAVYDDVMQGNISVNGSGTVYFQVASYFQGQTGTYILDINITRTAVSGIEETMQADFEIFPNPSRGIFTLQTGFQKPMNAEVSIYNTAGQSLKEFSLRQAGNNRYEVVLDAAPGIYFVSMKTEEGVRTKKIVME